MHNAVQLVSLAGSLLTVSCITASPCQGELVDFFSSPAIIIPLDRAEYLVPLASLKDGWDNDGAPAPNRDALFSADLVMRWALERGLMIADVDADVLGGVGVWVRGHVGHAQREAWISCLNGGQRTVVLNDGGRMAGYLPWTESSMDDTFKFLRQRCNAHT